MQLSQHFSLAELIKSRTAIRKGIKNEPTPLQVTNLMALCTRVLQPVREVMLRPLVISSGFRSKELNAAEGGAPNSQHLCLKDHAASDLEIPPLDNCFVAHGIAQLMREKGLPVDQLILEFYVRGVPTSGWIHISHRHTERNRGEIMHAVKHANGKTVYLPGLPEIP